MRVIRLAVNICTYHRKNYIEKNIAKLLASDFFRDEASDYYGGMQIFVVDNGAELPVQNTEFLHIFHNRNTGGSGGFQRGLEEIRAYPEEFSHVVFMDDDVEFEMDAFYLLFDFLRKVEDVYADRPVAGRMMCLDRPEIQYTAAEIWNGGDLRHVGFMQDMSGDRTPPGTADYACGADYGGWWFCCFPMRFARENDVLPFFIHCDDVEYGLRCGKPPIIITGVQVWHETYVYRQTPLMLYYDTRNPLFVNEIYGLLPDARTLYEEWKMKISKYHVEQDWLSEYYVILAMNDFLKGMRWLKRVDSEKKHQALVKSKSSRIRNAVMWRIVALKMRLKRL